MKTFFNKYNQQIAFVKKYNYLILYMYLKTNHEIVVTLNHFKTNCQMSLFIPKCSTLYNVFLMSLFIYIQCNESRRLLRNKRMALNGTAMLCGYCFAVETQA